jgi:hypothetical protein
MDPQQSRAQVKATRDRIDRKLDLIQARVKHSRGRANRIAFVSGAILSALFFWARRRQSRNRQRARANHP